MKSKKQLKEEISTYLASSDKDILDELTPDQLAELEEAIREDDRGEGIDYPEFKKSFDEWRTNLKSTKDSKKM